MKYYEVIGDSGGIVRRGFCPNCGARLFAKTAASPDIMSIMAGSLDDPTWYGPQADIYTASGQPWGYMNPDLPKFPKAATAIVGGSGVTLRIDEPSFLCDKDVLQGPRALSS